MSPPSALMETRKSEQNLPQGSVAAAAPGAGKPSLVTHGLTVQGPQQGLAMVNGRKRIENRGWKIPNGWYALHVGAKPLAALGLEWVARMREVWPDVPSEESLPSSSIIGLFHVCEVRIPAECQSLGLQTMWAVGPMCHFIDQAVQFQRPIKHRGNARLWAISEGAREEIKKQAEMSPVTIFDPL